MILELCFTCLFSETEISSRDRDLTNFYAMLCSSPQFCSEADQVVQFVVNELCPTLSTELEEFLEKEAKQKNDTSNILEYKELKFLKVVLKLSHENKQDLVDAQLLTQDDNEDVPIAMKQLINKVVWSNYDFELLQNLSIAFKKNQRLKRFVPMIDEVKEAQSITDAFLKG